MSVCCPPSPDRVQSALKDFAIRLRNAESLLKTVEAQIGPVSGLIPNGSVSRYSANGERKTFKSATPSGSSRWATALKPALQTASNGDRIRIEVAGCNIPAGQNMSQWLPSGVTDVQVTCIDEGAAHIYGTPASSSADVALFPGRTRNVCHFGAPVLPFYSEASGLAVDSAPFIQAALNSLPLLYTSDGVPATAEGKLQRNGTVFVPGGPGNWFFLGSQIEIGQGKLLQFENPDIGICVLPGVAPDVNVDKGIFRVIINDQGPNFTHRVGIAGRPLITSYSGNPGICAVEYSGAQMSSIELSCAYLKRGVIVINESNYTDIPFLDCYFLSHGPALDMRGNSAIPNFRVGLVSAFGCNIAGNQEDSRTIPTYRLKGNKGFEASSLLAESCGSGVEILNSRGVSIQNFYFSKHTDATAAATAVYMDAHSFTRIGYIHSVNANTFLRDITGGITIAGSGTQEQCYQDIIQNMSNADITSITSRVLQSTEISLTTTLPRIIWKRPDSTTTLNQWVADVSSSAGNPEWSLYSQYPATANRPQIQVGINKGLTETGYTVTFPDAPGGAYFYGKVNSLTGYKVNGLQTVGARDTGWTAMTGTASKAALATYTAPTVSASYVQAEVQAIANALQALSRRYKALDDLSMTNGVTSP